MEQRLNTAFRMSINEKTFIETALNSDLRIDGRRPFDYRRLTIKFGTEDGSSEVFLGQTHVMGFVTCQLVQPYRDKMNEGTLSIFTEFSPMADPSFEAGRPGEFAVELGRIVDRGLRESRAVDTESLSVLAGKYVWSIRVDLHILDNGGNLVDAANIAALAALLTFRMPECTLGGEDGQEVIIHPPELKEPLPLRIHHLPIDVTFAFFGDGNIVVIDPSHEEEAVMGGRMTATLNANSDVCAIQKAGGEGVLPSTIMQCLRIASVKAADITNKIKEAVEAYTTERALKKIKRHSSMVAVDVTVPDLKKENHQSQSTLSKDMGELSMQSVGLKVKPDGSNSSANDCFKVENRSNENNDEEKGQTLKKHIRAPANWDPYSKGIDSESLKASLASGRLTPSKKQKVPRVDQEPSEAKHQEPTTLTSNAASSSSPSEAEGIGQQTVTVAKTLKDAVKPKNRRRKKKAFSGNEEGN